MNIKEVYLRFMQLVNGNMTNNNINVDRARFILLYRAAEIRFIENVLDKKNDDSIRYVSDLLVPDKKLLKIGDKPTHTAFKLPEDYFDLEGAFAISIKDGCSARLKLNEVKSANIEELYNDWSHEPTFKWRSTFYHTASGKLLIYRKDFTITESFLTYYRKPRKVDIEGYVDLNGQASINVNPELPEKAIEKILRIMAKEVSANKGDSGQYQLDRDRLNSPT